MKSSRVGEGFYGEGLWAICGEDQRFVFKMILGLLEIMMSAFSLRSWGLHGACSKRTGDGAAPGLVGACRVFVQS